MSVPFGDTHLRIPRGFGAVLEGLVREILRDQPGDIPNYAALYFKHLLKQREESGVDPSEWAGSLEDRYEFNRAFQAISEQEPATGGSTSKDKPPDSQVEDQAAQPAEATQVSAIDLDNTKNDDLTERQSGELKEEGNAEAEEPEDEAWLQSDLVEADTEDAETDAEVDGKADAEADEESEAQASEQEEPEASTEEVKADDNEEDEDDNSQAIDEENPQIQSEETEGIQTQSETLDEDQEAGDQEGETTEEGGALMEAANEEGEGSADNNEDLVEVDFEEISEADMAQQPEEDKGPEEVTEVEDPDEQDNDGPGMEEERDDQDKEEIKDEAVAEHPGEADATETDEQQGD